MLPERIENKAEKHFQKGLTLYNSGFRELARIEFLKTLSYDRENLHALGYLKNDFNQERTLLYEVKTGDTFQSIAEEVYKNTENDYLVRYFFNSSKFNELSEGRVLKLPVIPLSFKKLFFNFTKEILKARKLFKVKDYEQLLKETENILRHDSLNNEARYMKNTACFNLGIRYFHDEKYQKAIAMLNKVDKYFRNVQKDISIINNALNKRKNEEQEKINNDLYQQGLIFFKNDEYQSALICFRDVDNGYANVNDLIDTVERRMKKKADLHYKNGVKYFVNEELKKAIEEWKKALGFDPDNTIIKRDIENSMNLLEKIKKMH